MRERVLFAWETISRVGFASVEIDHFLYPGSGPVASHIAGTAVKG